jgi:pSer/pThr/pTyr-binding forkhead associated (FHA) protein
MGALEDLQSGRKIYLVTDTLVGRGADYHVALTDHAVSAPHASLRWSGQEWVARDLGSRNGTFVGERRLHEGERAHLSEGTLLRFGSDSARFRLADASGPDAIAYDVETGETMGARNGLLVLPREDEPLASIFESAEGDWVCERDEDLVKLQDRGVIEVGGRKWQLKLPSLTAPTWEASRPIAMLETIELQFRVSLDEEHVELRVAHESDLNELPPRAFHYLLLTLARARSEDRELPDPEQGWVDREELCKMLKTDQVKLNVDIFRARKQFGELGIVGAPSIVERRPTTRAIRLGVGRFTISPL